jgi:hypothetical protein
MSDKISIKGLCKITLLRKMWENQRVASFFGASSGPSFDEREANNLLQKGYIDYLCGRAIKADLSGEFVNGCAYNRDSYRRLEDIVSDIM